MTNLHRHRVSWWAQALEKSNAPKELAEKMLISKFDADHQVPLAESFTEYFDGVQANSKNGAISPDRDFFDNRVAYQVRGKTLWQTWKNNFLDSKALSGIPIFLCGGGARMKYYLELESELTPKMGCTWLHAESWTMGVPGDLLADGLNDADYDRISVAYGLSRLEVGKVIKVIPLPKVAIEPVDSWRDNYVDKDQC
ncbi:MAG: hypothetical protein ABIR13_04575 [Polaromonas sp.]